MHAPKIVVPKPVTGHKHTCHDLYDAFERFAKESTVKVTPPATNNEGSFKRTRLPPIQPKPKLEIAKDVAEATIIDEPVKPSVKLEISKDLEEVDIFNEMIATCKVSKDFVYSVKHKQHDQLVDIVIKQRTELYNRGREIVELRREIEHLTQWLGEKLEDEGNDIGFLIREAYVE